MRHSSPLTGSSRWLGRGFDVTSAALSSPRHEERCREIVRAVKTFPSLFAKLPFASFYGSVFLGGTREGKGDVQGRSASLLRCLLIPSQNLRLYVFEASARVKPCARAVH